jgi:hypothetical protein
VLQSALTVIFHCLGSCQASKRLDFILHESSRCNKVTFHNTLSFRIGCCSISKCSFVSNMAVTQKKSPVLLTLPKEVRLRIYEYVFIDSEVFLDRQSRHGKKWSLRYDQEVCLFRIQDLNVLLSCRTIWDEGMQSIQTARLKQCSDPTDIVYTDEQLCYVLLSEAEGIHPKHLITSCTRPRCLKSIIHNQAVPSLQSIEWHTSIRFSPPCINDCLPTGSTVLRSVVFETEGRTYGYRMPLWRDRIYDVKTEDSSRLLRITIKPC